MLTVYVVVNLLLLIAVLLDYVFNKGNLFLVYEEDELKTALVAMLLPLFNLYTLYAIYKSHRKG